MKFVSQCALVGVLFAACAVPLEIVDDVQFASPDASVSAGGSGAVGNGTGGTGLSGAGGAVAQGGAGVAMGGSGFTQGGTGGAVAQGGAGGMGGSMMAMGGEAGMGMGGTGVEPPPDNCVETGSVGGFDVEVYYTGNAQAQTMGMTLAIRSTGTSFNTNQLRVRYWFTPGTTQAFVGEIDSAQLQNPYVDIRDNVNITFGQIEDVSAYAEIAVNRDAPIGVGIDTIQWRLRSENYANLTHTDDFSFVPNVTMLTLNPNISAYVGDVQVFGCEPPTP